jgi:hypothetical protein
MLTKAFSFDGEPFAPPDPLPVFDFVVRNSVGTVVARVPFDLNHFTWRGAPLNRYELSVPLTLPVGTYTVTKDPQIVDLPPYFHLPQPGANTVVVPPSGIGIVNFINKYFTPLPVEHLPALRLRKIFHGLPENVYPPRFQIRIVGPSPVNGVAVVPQPDNPVPGWTLNALTNRYELTLSRAAAMAGITLLHLTPGSYEIYETNYDGVLDFEFDRVSWMEREINIGHSYSYGAQSTVPSPLHIVSLDSEDDTIVRIDNFYVPSTTTPSPPSWHQPPWSHHPQHPPLGVYAPPIIPQTGVERHMILPIIAIILGIGAFVGAGFYLRASKKVRSDS